MWWPHTRDSIRSAQAGPFRVQRDESEEQNTDGGAQGSLWLDGLPS